MSDRPDKPNDKTNDGDGSRLSSSVQNQVFDEMIAQSAASGKWGGKNQHNASSDAASAEHSSASSAATAQKQQEQQRPGEAQAASKPAPGVDNLAALTTTKAQQEEITRPPTNSLLTAASRELDDLAFGKRATDNSAVASEQAKALGLNLVKNSQQEARLGTGTDSRDNPNILNIPVPIEFIRDGLRALQEKSLTTNVTENQAINTEVQRRQQLDANIQDKQEKQENKEKQNPEGRNTERTNLPADAVANPEIQTNRVADLNIRETVVNNEARSEARAEAVAAKLQEVQQQADKGAGKVTDQADIKDTGAARQSPEINTQKDQVTGSAARGNTEGGARVESDQTRGAVRENINRAIDGVVAAMDARVAAQVSMDGQNVQADAAREVPATKDADKAEEKTEDNPIVKLGKAIADFARRVLATLFGDAGGDAKKEKSMEKEEGDSSETESEDERQKKIQEEQRPTYIVMEGDYLELVSTKLYSNTMFTTLLKKLNPDLSITRQYLGVLGTEVDMLKTGEHIMLPMQTEIEEFLRTV